MDVNVKDIIKEVTEKIQKNTNCKAVFGEPVEKGDIMIIPVARMTLWGAGGGGFGEMKKEKQKSEEKNKDEGGGMGMSIHAKTEPAGYIEIRSDGAKFVEIFEQKRIIFAGIGLGAFAIFMFSRLLSKLIKKKKK
jgi:uncharacterized spore protein YtfJ